MRRLARRKCLKLTVLDDSCFCCPNPYRSVQQGSIGLVSRFGEYDRSVPAGLVKVNPFSEKLRVVDVKIQIANIVSLLLLDGMDSR